MIFHIWDRQRRTEVMRKAQRFANEYRVLQYLHKTHLWHKKEG